MRSSSSSSRLSHFLFPSVCTKLVCLNIIIIFLVSQITINLIDMYSVIKNVRWTKKKGVATLKCNIIIIIIIIINIIIIHRRISSTVFTIPLFPLVEYHCWFSTATIDLKPSVGRPGTFLVNYRHRRWLM